jgi:hypothetical protein
MALSFAQAQQALLNSGDLDSFGDNRNDLGVSLDRTNSAVIRAAARFVTDARDNLNKADRTSSGHLETSIKPKLVQFNNGVTIIDIYVASYYKFVDAGVQGLRGGTSTKGYRFRKPGVGGAMLENIKAWVTHENITFRNTKVPVTTREHKRATLKDATTKTAYVIARSIKKKGLKPSNFWADALRELEKDIATGVASALRIDVIETFDQLNKP